MTGDAGPGILTSGRYDAALFDMDGVVTDTASIHASCWKTMFDDFLRKRAAGGAFRPFDINTDYGVYVDGKPRYEGVRDFLTSRDIALPEGTRDSPPTEESICGLGNRKNELVNERFAASGVTAYPGTVALLRMLRPAGIKTALVTSSQNAHLVLRAAKLEAMFDALVDGDVLAANNLPGKPAPDCFLKAAEMLGVPPSRAVVIEDAISGVQAGAAGGFGLVIGVARKHDADALRTNGATMVVEDLAEIIP
jgi:beta-phosphoglucomutase family hydrolase